MSTFKSIKNRAPKPGPAVREVRRYIPGEPSKSDETSYMKVAGSRPEKKKQR